MRTPKNATPERLAQIRERNRAYKRKQREALYAAGLTATKKPRTVSDEVHVAQREDTLRRAAEARGELVHPKGCPCYDCLWGEPSWLPSNSPSSLSRPGPLGTLIGEPSPSVENLIRAIEG